MRIRQTTPRRASALLAALLVSSTLSLGPGAQPASADHVSGVSHDLPLAASRIVYDAVDGGDRDIFISDESGTFRRNLTAGFPGLDSDPVLSPDGTKISFTSDRGANVREDVWVMDADGTDPVNLTGAYGDFYDADAAWSPDGNTIAFARETGGFGIFTVPAAGGAAPFQVSPVASTTGFPSWSPNGQWIVYRSDRSGNHEIYITDADTNTFGANITNSPAEDQSPAWSPDGSQIAFTSDRDGGGRDLWVTEAFVAPGQARTFEKLLARPGVQGHPAWNPDGQQLAFHEQATGAVGEPGSIAILNLATGAVSPLPTPPNAFLPDWYSSVSLVGSPGATRPGATFVDPTAIDPTLLPLTAPSDIEGAPLRSIDVAPDVASTPLRSIDIAASPLRSIPLRSIPLRSIPLRSIPLRSITLSQIPLRSIDLTWEDVLAGTPLAGVPLQNVTLDQVLELDPAGLDDIGLENLDLASTPLRSISIASLALGATPLRSIPLRSIGPNETPDNFGEWCALLASLGYGCQALGLTADSPILALDLAGIPLRSIPLRSIPLRSIPLRSIDVGSAPLRSIPLRSIPLRSIEIGTLTLGMIDDAKESSLVLSCQPVSCTPQTTLGELSGQLVPTATFGDLVDALSQGIPQAFTLLNLLQGLVPVADYPWETLPVEDIGVQDFAGQGAPTVPYSAKAKISGAADSAQVSFSVELPKGFRYAAGSSFRVGPGAVSVPAPEPTASGRTLTWQLGSAVDGDLVGLDFRLRPSLTLQEGARPTLTVAVGDRIARTPSSGSTDVVEDLESVPANDTVAGAVLVRTNRLVISHIGTPGDVDYFKIPVPAPGTRLQVKLGNPGDADLDVVLLNSAPKDPIASAPLRSIPLRSIPIPDNGLSVAASTDALSSEVLDDIPNVDLAATPLRSISQNRSTADELLETTTDADSPPGAVYYIQVSGFNGASSDLPYVLYVKEYAPPAPPECADPRVFPLAGQGVAGQAPSASAIAGKTTLILTSPKRLGDTHGRQQADAAVGRLQALAASPLVNGVVYPIEAGAAGALAAWDADPCSPEKANDVVGAVTSIVEDVRDASPGLKHIVIAGGDDIVPFARVADYTQLSNESDYTADVLTDAGKGNPIAAAVATQNILSDDPYGDEDPIPWLDHYLYVPEQSLGRLVETPADIAAQADQFLASGGNLDPTTALTAGYDFLTDGSDAVDTALGNRLPASAREKLVNETWDRADLVDALFPATGGSPSIGSLNAHYDHNRALPALGNSTSDESDLFTVDDITARPPLALLERILFTMGCHAGLAMPDAYVEAASETGGDWAETYLGVQQKAAVYFANTGFGYGDTAAVALSERLMELFAERLDGSMTVGEAAVYAKQSYFGSLGAYGPYDEKALQEATFYGLPMYKIGAGATPLPSSPKVSTDPGTVPSVGVALTTDFETNASPAGGTFSTVGGGTFVVDGLGGPGSLGESQVTQYRPIVPRTSKLITADDPTKEAKGFLVTELESDDVPVIPAVARPVVDLSANEPPPPVGDVAFPTSFSNISSYEGPGGKEQRLVLLPGQVFRNGDGGQGAVERRFGKIAGQVFYGSSTSTSDQTAPFLTNVTSELTAGSLRLSVAVEDESPIVRVIALVKDDSNQWRRVEMTGPSPADGTYTGTIAVLGDEVEYFVQALNSEGLVALSTNKGRYYLGAAGESPAAPAVLSPAPSAPAGGNGWFTGDVGVVVVGTSGTVYEIFVDGERQLPDISGDGTVEVTGEGTHTVEAKGSDGTTSSLLVRIDTIEPTVSIAGLDQAYTQDELIPRCEGSDGGSGLASCTIQVGPGPGGSPSGVFTATATAVDVAGNMATTSATYAVGVRTFSGFLQPVNDTGEAIIASTSIFKAGSTVPVRFRLFDAAGNPVSAAVTPRFSATRTLTRVTGTPESIEILAPSSGSAFTYDSLTGTYQYNWKTAKNMAGYYWRISVDLGYGRTEVVVVGLR